MLPRTLQKCMPACTSYNACKSLFRKWCTCVYEYMFDFADRGDRAVYVSRGSAGSPLLELRVRIPPGQ